MNAVCGHALGARVGGAEWHGMSFNILKCLTSKKVITTFSHLFYIFSENLENH